jgi:hypothetical protein
MEAAMRKSAALLLLTFILTSCGERKVSIYSTYAEAVKDGAVDRGWVPEFIPAYATEIYEAHDVDTNQVAVTFVAQNSAFLGSLSLLGDSYRPDAMSIFNSVNFPGEPLASHGKYYYLCGSEGIGLLTSDRKSGRLYYFEPIQDKKLLKLCS